MQLARSLCISAAADPQWGWVGGAVAGFATAFFVQLFTGNWKLWVDHRKSVLDDLIKAIDAGRLAAVAYYEQPAIAAGGATPAAREVTYTQKTCADLFGILDRRFGPVSKAAHKAFREFRELTTGDYFRIAAPANPEHAVLTAMAAVSCASLLRDWGCEQLSPWRTIYLWATRHWNRYFVMRSTGPT